MRPLMHPPLTFLRPYPYPPTQVFRPPERAPSSPPPSRPLDMADPPSLAATWATLTTRASQPGVVNLTQGAADFHGCPTARQHAALALLGEPEPHGGPSRSSHGPSEASPTKTETKTETKTDTTEDATRTPRSPSRPVAPPTDLARVGPLANQYSASGGLLGLRGAIARMESEKLGWTVDPVSEVVITTSGTEAIYAICRAVCRAGNSSTASTTTTTTTTSKTNKVKQNPGPGPGPGQYRNRNTPDVILTLDPLFPWYKEAASAAGAKLVTVPLTVTTTRALAREKKRGEMQHRLKENRSGGGGGGDGDPAKGDRNGRGWGGWWGSGGRSVARVKEEEEEEGEGKGEGAEVGSSEEEECVFHLDMTLLTDAIRKHRPKVRRTETER